MNFDPNNLCLESPEFGSVLLVLHSSGHLLLSLVNPSNTLDQFTGDEQTMGSLQSKIRLLAGELSQRKREQWISLRPGRP